jgi:hypothetical protein
MTKLSTAKEYLQLLALTDLIFNNKDSLLHSNRILISWLHQISRMMTTGDIINHPKKDICKARTSSNLAASTQLRTPQSVSK